MVPHPSRQPKSARTEDDSARTRYDRVPLSVLIPVKNEAENLRRCLPALAWADEVFVVDSRSTDDDGRRRRRARRDGGPVPLQRHLSQEEELGAGEPPLPKRLGPDRRRRRGRDPRAGGGDRAADPPRRGGGFLSQLALLFPRTPDPPLRLLGMPGTSGCSSTGWAATSGCPTRPVGVRRQRGTRARRARRPGPPARSTSSNITPIQRWPSGSRSTTAMPSGRPCSTAASRRADPGGDRPGPAVPTPAEEVRLAAARCGRSFASSTPTSCGSASSMAARG